MEKRPVYLNVGKMPESFPVMLQQTFRDEETGGGMMGFIPTEWSLGLN
jgi:hypothetical protein